MLFWSLSLDKIQRLIPGGACAGVLAKQSLAVDVCSDLNNHMSKTIQSETHTWVNVMIWGNKKKLTKLPEQQLACSLLNPSQLNQAASSVAGVTGEAVRQIAKIHKATIHQS